MGKHHGVQKDHPGPKCCHVHWGFKNFTRATSAVLSLVSAVMVYVGRGESVGTTVEWGGVILSILSAALVSATIFDVVTFFPPAAIGIALAILGATVGDGVFFYRWYEDSSTATSCPELSTTFCGSTVAKSGLYLFIVTVALQVLCSFLAFWSGTCGKVGKAEELADKAGLLEMGKSRRRTSRRAARERAASRASLDGRAARKMAFESDSEEDEDEEDERLMEGGGATGRGGI